MLLCLSSSVFQIVDLVLCQTLTSSCWVKRNFPAFWSVNYWVMLDRLKDCPSPSPPSSSGFPKLVPVLFCLWILVLCSTHPPLLWLFHTGEIVWSQLLCQILIKFSFMGHKLSLLGQTHLLTSSCSFSRHVWFFSFCYVYTWRENWNFDFLF